MLYIIGYTNSTVIYCCSTVITKVMLLYNREWQFDHEMAVNYCCKKFNNIGPWYHLAAIEFSLATFQTFTLSQNSNTKL